jgi:hypothetical protein
VNVRSSNADAKNLTSVINHRSCVGDFSVPFDVPNFSTGAVPNAFWERLVVATRSTSEKTSRKDKDKSDDSALQGASKW